MMQDSFLALAGFALATSITPGPNNLMLMASGANFGVRRTIPHMLGIGIGFTVMVILVGAGLLGVLEAFPAVHVALKVLSAGYLAILAWKIATAAAPDGPDPGARPLGFLEAAGFQWVNPKAWAMALTAIAVYAPDRSLGAVLGVAVVFGAINLPSVSLWTVLGQALGQLLADPARLRAFNWTMAVLLIGSFLPIL